MELRQKFWNKVWKNSTLADGAAPMTKFILFYFLLLNPMNQRCVLRAFCFIRYYRNDPEMQEFFAQLLHVKYDLTGYGQLQVGQPAPSVPLYTMDQTLTGLDYYINHAKQRGKVLCVIAGSWTW